MVRCAENDGDIDLKHILKTTTTTTSQQRKLVTCLNWPNSGTQQYRFNHRNAKKKKDNYQENRRYITIKLKSKKKNEETIKVFQNFAKYKQTAAFHQKVSVNQESHDKSW